MERVNALSSDRRKLLEKMFREKKARKKSQHSPIQAIPRRADQGVFPMSFAQQRMWVIDQLQPGTPLYNEHGQLHFRGHVDLTLLEECMNQIIERHEALRTTFATSFGKPVQVIARQMRLPLPLIDLQDLPEQLRGQEVRRLSTEEARQPFDLASGAPLRVKVVRLAPDEHYVLITMHQIISDGWSVWVLTNEVASLYDSLVEGRPSRLPELRIQYTDYSAWQRDMLRGEVLQDQLSYWKERLTDSIPYLDLPVDRHYSNVKTYEAANKMIRLSRPLSEAIKSLSQSQDVTPFVTVTAAFKLLVSRYSRQTDISLAVPVAGRNHLDLESLIGFFVNVLILRTDLSGDPSFLEVMRRLHQAAVGAYANQDLPFDKLIEELQPERNVRRAPFFDVLINFNNLPRAPLMLKDLSITRVDLHEPVAKFPITVYVEESDEQFNIRFLYQTELFTEERIRSILDQFESLLAQVTADPSRPLSAYSLVTPSSRPVLPDPVVSIPEPTLQPITEIIKAWAAETPDLIALKQGEATLTYGELVERASLIAKALVAGGLGRGEVIGVIGPRGFGLVASLTGALLSGGMVLSLDRRLPASRRRLMLREAGARALVHIDDGSGEDLLPGDWPGPVIRVSSSEARVLGEACSGLGDVSLPPIAPRDRAYVFFTSGTTSVPKGVVGWHNALSHFLQWQRGKFRITPQDRCAQLTGLSFDVVLRDIFLPLVGGATLCLSDDPEDVAADHILPWLERDRISVIHTTPSIAQSWLSRVGRDAPLPCLRYVFFAGEPLTEGLVSSWRKSFPGPARIINLYGPTETTLAKCFYEVPSGDNLLPQIQPIGRPLPDTQVLILGENNRLCAPNELGEIVIRTPLASLGYINDQGGARSRFAPNPFREDERDRVYYTGDLGRYRLDGSLEIVGRLDNQVKIRGIRIEPDEVTAVLAAHPGVQSCIVVATKDGNSGDALIAYLVAAKDEPLSSSELRAYLSARLPAAMVPSAFVFLDSLPLTPNGKVDRRALPPAPVRASDEAVEFVSPRTAIERTLAEIWARALGRECVGINDNFFELGGHSLLATELMLDVRNAFRVNVPLRSLFESPTVAGLAEVIEGLSGAEGVNSSALATLPRITANLDDRHRPFPLTDIQQAYWVGRTSNFELGQVATHNYSEFEFLDLHLDLLNGAFERLIKRHDMLRAIVLPGGDQQILEQVPPYTIELIDLRGVDKAQAGEALQSIRKRLSHQVLRTDRWPLFEVVASRHDERRYLIHISIDALICDAWSRRTLGRELLYLYYNPEAQLPPIALSFRDYVLAERELRQTELYEKAKQYWLNRLDDLPPAPQLPLAQNPASLESPRFVRWRAELDPQSWHRLKERAGRAGLTPSGLMCAAYAEVLSIWSKSLCFTINLTLFNRLPLHPDVNSIVGDFTSLILLAVDNRPADTFIDRARRIQKQLWNDIDHAYYSGIQVLRDLNRRAGGATRAMMPVVLTSTLFEGRRERDEFIAAWQDDLLYGISQTPQVYLDHGVSERDGALVYGWDAVPELFPENLLETMFEAYRRLLRRLADEEQSWHDPSCQWMLPDEQLRRRTDPAASAWRCPRGLLHSSFQAQARSTPDNLAVITESKSLTYSQLQAHSTLLARRLRRLGLKPNQLVAVLMQKGWQQVAAALAILEAGCAYLPVDADLPRQRRDYLLEVGEVKAVLTQPWLADTVRPGCGVEVVEVGEASQAEMQEALSQGPLEQVQQETDLAYVIFTSGSTGEPKGVMIEHGGAVNTIADINSRYAVGERDRALGLSSLSFDLSVWDIFGMLSVGGAVVLPEGGWAKDPAQWLRLMRERGVTICNSVPAFMEMMVEYAAGRGERLNEELRLVMMSGDWIGVSLPERIREVSEGVKVVSLGGATEGSIWSIQYEVGEVREEWKSIPYGRAMRGQSMYVLDGRGEQRAEWVVGELYIGGAGVARGYWRDEQRTREKFVEVRGERLYRTGDLGRYMGDGEIEFLGREDQQVKVQGHRIELGEVEAAMVKKEGVKEAVVTAVGEGRGHKRLVAYVVLQKPSPDPNGEKQNGQPQSAVLLSKQDRDAFKKRQAGLRSLAEGDGAIDLAFTGSLAEMGQAFFERRTHRNFLDEPVSFDQFSDFLSCLRQVQLDGKAKYMYGSGGGLYPVQTYIHVKPGGVEGVAAGTYYYHPVEHKLVCLSEHETLDETIHWPSNRGTFRQSHFSIFLVSEMDAISPMYGNVARDFCLLEAGAMTQLLAMASSSHQIGLCQVGSVDFDRVRGSCKLKDSQVLLHTLIGGRAVPANVGQVGLPGNGEPHPGSNGAKPANRAGLNAAAEIEEIKKYLSQVLPDYMVPSSIVLLDALPLNPNGKVDRKALPAPEALQAEVSKEFVPPQTELEKKIALAIGEEIQTHRVGIKDNFFDLGATSLSLVRVHGRLQAALGRDFPVVDLFRHSTVESLARHLSRPSDPAATQGDEQERAAKRKRSRQRLKEKLDK
jgi:amino acid adenylation domain-containing protein